MKNIHEVLRAKEQLLEQTQRDIEALRHTIKLLSDEESGDVVSAGASSLSAMPVPPMMMRPAGAKDPGYSAWDAGSKQLP
ncbi:MAG TPA: hypothetical protein VMS96_04190 [Terriglobales bacterium]|nr:hypothetical protein [Terriglobales bacterium]